VDVTWNVRTSTALTDAQRERALKALAPRLSADGSMRVVASDTRSQKQNRELAEQRLAEAVRRALLVPKKRKATRPTRSSVEKRLEGKKHSADKKRARRRPTED
jgi:ribosome-associated protein